MPENCRIVLPAPPAYEGDHDMTRVSWFVTRTLGNPPNMELTNKVFEEMYNQG
jgi:hypothetical protein